MSGNGVLLDSVILIDHFNDIPAATAYLRRVRDDAHVSAITRVEVLTGLTGASRQSAASFLDCFGFLSIGRDVADLAAELRNVHGWKLADSIQAGVALHNHLDLATRNTKDFNPDRHSFVVVPYVLLSGGGVA